jgi:polysaccharide biosynthesis protein PslJ
VGSRRQEQAEALSAPTVHPTDFEPALAGQHTYVTRRRLGRLDAALICVVTIALTTALPTVLIVPNTSDDIGRPAVIMCMLMFAWWIASRSHPRLAMSGPQPIRWAVLILLLSMLLSHAAGFERGLTALEVNAADRMLLTIAAFFGVILMVADGLSNWDRMRFVLKTIVWGAVFMSLIGLLQILLPFDPVEYLKLPGLQARPLIGLQERGSGFRVAATTTHYLELSGSLALAFPIAMHFATHPPTPKQRRWYVFATAVIAVGVLLTISRTGIIAIGMATLILMPMWGWRQRYNVLALGVAMFMALSVAAPSMSRTLINLFADFSSDPSITSRTDRYEFVAFYFAQRPWFGRGSGTWVPPMYQYLDNQWLRTALENGIIGVAARATVHQIAMSVAIIAVKRAATKEDRHLALALAATQVQAMFISYTFDSMAYSTYVTILGAMIGMCGTIWRFTHPARRVRTSTAHWFGP